MTFYSRIPPIVLYIESVRLSFCIIPQSQHIQPHGLKDVRSRL
jgi:hypothetical protein